MSHERLGVAIWVESLLGYGHAMRALNLAKALPGWRRLVLSGSLQKSALLAVDEDIELVALDPLKLDAPTGPLAAADGDEMSAVRTRRVERAWSAVSAHRPQLLILEHFPFGRWGFRDELIELVARTRAYLPECSIVSSVRDIPQGDERPDGYGRGVAMALDRAFDLVVVHGERDLVDIRDLVPELRTVSIPITETGYLTDAVHLGYDPSGPVLIDLGGGWQDERFLDLVLGALSRSAGASIIDVIAMTGAHSSMSGANLPGFANLNITLRKDLHLRELPALRAVVSRLGYNSSVQLIGSRVPAIGAPHEFSSEQIHRGAVLARSGRLVVIEEARLAGGEIDLGAALERARHLGSRWRPRSTDARALGVLLERQARAKAVVHD